MIKGRKKEKETNAKDLEQGVLMSDAWELYRQLASLRLLYGHDVRVVVRVNAAGVFVHRSMIDSEGDSVPDSALVDALGFAHDIHKRRLDRTERLADYFG